jgi:hypothetical protein
MGIVNLNDCAFRSGNLAEKYREESLTTADPLLRTYYHNLAGIYDCLAKGVIETALLVDRIEATAARTKARRGATYAA